MVMSFTRI